MTYKQFEPNTYSKTLDRGSVSWQSPSNIALVKYWGKYGEQLPKNPSISFTLSNCHTNTSVEYTIKTSKGFAFEVYLDGQRAQGFEPKILKFFERISPYLGFLEDYTFRIETSNSFPHSSGIASSASGLSALALCIMSIEQRLLHIKLNDDAFYQKASFLARLGSGSACRSIEGPLMVWGSHREIEGSSDLYGTKYPYKVHPIFNNFQDTILLVDQGEKQVSSTVGHGLMQRHPYAESRFEQANFNAARLKAVFERGDLDTFMECVESEALQLHAMMMTSVPYFILMKPNTLEIINRIWAYRKATGNKVCFTLDAGANVHLLYPEVEKAAVIQFIESDLKQLCDNGAFIHDQLGSGAVEIG